MSQFILKKFVQECKEASKYVATLSSLKKIHVLQTIADYLIEFTDEILSENKKDMINAIANDISKPMQDRLLLTSDRVKSMSDAVLEVSDLEDPIGNISSFVQRPNGIKVGKMSIPLGVIAVIYEARPNVTSDAAALCFKAGNGIILRGGSNAYNSNLKIVEIIHKALKAEDVPENIISFIPDTDRKVMEELLTYDELIDLVIPRGGEGLIRFVSKNSSIPVIKHYKGVCHMYIDDSADLDMAIDLFIDGKTSRPSVCNSLETLLVNEKVAEEFFQKVTNNKILQKVEIAGCEKTVEYIPGIKIATEEDYNAEYLDLKIAVKVVDNIKNAVKHIQRYSSDHTEVIVTNSYDNSQYFMNTVNSAVIMVNASSRFSDGGELGLGAEIGISTTKLHSYGPMGIKSLTTEKFVVLGNGQVRHRIG